MEYPKPAYNDPITKIPRAFLGPQLDTDPSRVTKPALELIAHRSHQLPTEPGVAYDWQYGVTTLARDYLPGGIPFAEFSYDRLLEIEALFERSWRWFQPEAPEDHLLTPVERFFKGFFKHVCESMDLEPFMAYRNLDVPLLLPTYELERRMNIYKSTRPLVYDPETHTYVSFDTLSATLKGYEKYGVTKKNAIAKHDALKVEGPQLWAQYEEEPEDTILINVEHHLQELEAKVPQPPRELFERELEVIRRPETHPIEQAARLWFFELKHPSSAIGSRQAGRALAGIVLLSHGYTPPTLSAEQLRQGKASVRQFIQVLSTAIQKEQNVAARRHWCALV
ncbi:MAG: hypothetical protein KDK64_08125 [Chlamydiia bacterium]|nr:hypothetical protein [Chlamydiia bacterium]